MENQVKRQRKINITNSPPAWGTPSRRGRTKENLTHFFGHPPLPRRPRSTAMARPVPIAPCRSPFAASRPAPSCAPVPEQHHGGHTSPTPPSPCRRGWGCCVWGDKTARLLRKSAQLLRETCRLFAQLPFIVLDAAHPADRACRTRVHTAGDNPNGKPAKNTLFPLSPSPPYVALARSAPFANPLQKRRFLPRFRGQKRAKKQPAEAFLPAFLAQNG